MKISFYFNGYYRYKYIPLKKVILLMNPSNIKVGFKYIKL